MCQGQVKKMCYANLNCQNVQLYPCRPTKVKEIFLFNRITKKWEFQLPQPVLKCLDLLDVDMKMFKDLLVL